MASDAARATARRVGVTTSLVLVATASFCLVAGLIEPVDLLVPGGRGPSADLIVEDFGPIPPDRAERPGYDGQQVYAIARSFPHLNDAVPHLDHARYRSFRILPSLLAAPFPAGAPTVVALMVVSAVGVGLAAAGLADLCARHGRDPRLAYLGAAPLLISFAFSTPDALGYGLAFVGLALFDRDRMTAATVAISLAVLAKEPALVMAVGAALATWSSHRWRSAPFVLVPAAVAAAWWIVLGPLVGGELPSSFDLLGALDAATSGQLVYVTFLALVVIGAWRWRDVPTVWPTPVLFGLWGLTWYEPIIDWAALPRVAAPVFALGLVALGDLVLRGRTAASPRTATTLAQ